MVGTLASGLETRGSNGKWPETTQGQHWYFKRLGDWRGRRNHLFKRRNPRLPVIGGFCWTQALLVWRKTRKCICSPFSEVLQAHQHGPIKGLRQGVGAFSAFSMINASTFWVMWGIIPSLWAWQGCSGRSWPQASEKSLLCLLFHLLEGHGDLWDYFPLLSWFFFVGSSWSHPRGRMGVGGGPRQLGFFSWWVAGLEQSPASQPSLPQPPPTA